MLLIFLYHQACSGKYGNSLEMLDKHFYYLSKNYLTVFPNDSLQLFLTNICLTFDDAHLDFYTKVYPLLKKYRLKAVLAVPVDLIETPLYCTWSMLQEMAKSDTVQIASHSMSHTNLLDSNANIYYELTESKKTLERKLNVKINTFIYPYGKFNKKIHNEVKQHYKYIMRIGSSINISWHNTKKILYRIPSDNLLSPTEKLTYIKKALYFFNFIKNTLRCR